MLVLGKINQIGPIKFWELLSECVKVGLLEFKKSEYSMIITLPQVADMQDETNRKKTKEIFGKPRLSADEMKAIAEGKSGNILEQTREEETRENSGLVKDSNNKGELIPNTDEHFKAYERRNNRYFQAKYGE